MMRREPPALALWLLKQWGSPYYGDSLAGDLIEQFHEGRTRAWCWRQVAAAILIARWRFVQAMPWTAAGRMVSRLVAETAAMLAVVVIVDQTRRTPALAGMMNHTFLSVLIVLIAVACTGFLVSIRPHLRKRGHAVIKTLMLVFGVIALGVGTLTWADTTRRDACQTPVCICPGN
jgi:hypothetical protein